MLKKKKIKAAHLVKKLRFYNFKTADGQLSKWKIQNDIKFKKQHEEQNIILKVQKSGNSKNY